MPTPAIAAAPERNKRVTLALIAIVAITVIAYSPALRAPLLFDDSASIQDNTSIRQIWPISVPLSPPAHTPVAGRPLVNLTFAVNYWINDALGIGHEADQTLGFHLLNLALHIACGLLLFGIVRRTLEAARYGHETPQRADMVAIVIAAIWLLHPLQTEAVDYLTQRTELLVSLCYLLMLYCSIRAWDANAGRPRTRWFIGGAIACLAGMLSKEVMVTAPLMIACYDRVFHFKTWRDIRDAGNRNRRLFYAALAATYIPFIALLISSPRGTAVGAQLGISPLEYLHSQGWAISHYLRLAIFPTGLSLDYGAMPVTHWRGVPGLIIVSLILAAIALAWRRTARLHWFAFLGAWFLLILAPSSSIVPIVTEIAAERRMYLPLAAIVVAIVIAIDLIFTRFRPAMRWTMPATILLLMATLGVLTFRRSELYQHPEMLWRDAAARFPSNARAWNNLGTVLVGQAEPKLAAADSAFRMAIALDSTNVDALLRVAMAEIDQRRYHEAAGHLHRVTLEFGNDTVVARIAMAALEIGDTTGAVVVLERLAEDAKTAERIDARVLLGRLLIQQRHPNEAERYLKEAVRESPSGISLALLSLDYADMGRRDSAVVVAREAIANAGSDERAYFIAGRAMLAIQRPDLAEQYLLGATKLSDRDAAAESSLGEAELERGETREATAAFQRALAIDPTDSTALAHLGRQR